MYGNENYKFSMQTETLLYIIGSGILALLLALFQYWYKSKTKTSKTVLFTFLRFLSYFGLLLLLVNPKITNTTYYTEKPTLVVAIDNSESIKHLNQNKNAQKVLSHLQSHTALSKQFNIDYFSFGSTLTILDSLNFTAQQTNIDKVFREFQQLYKNTTAAVLLVSDGNQTIGNDYEFSAKKLNQPIYPIILGDTITYVDLKINQLNVNKYVYLKNRFPVEVVMSYSGTKKVTTKFQVASGKSVVYSKNITFSKANTSQVLNFTLPANKAGVKSYSATISALPSEKNNINNTKNFAVEVIDQKTKIAIVSSIIHPDLGALKKSIESNEQRSVKLLKPNEAVTKLNDFQLVILYQPNAAFKQLISALDTQNKNRFIITGPKTDWAFLNTVSNYYSAELTNQTENYQPLLNTNYTAFIIDAIDFESYPPLQSHFGDIDFKAPIETILYKQLGTVNTQTPLMLTLEVNNRREALLMGENIWKWRAQNYLNEQSFNKFDNFIGKVVQYVASNKRKKRIDLDYQSFYNGNTNVVIKAQFFNKNYEFDNFENLTITVKNKKTTKVNSYPMLLKNNYYQVDLSHLPAAEYEFTVATSREKLKQSGHFKILEYNIEQQFLNANVTKLQQLATYSKGNSYFTTNYNTLFDNLIKDKRYLPTQKKVEKIGALIDWKYLLFLIALTLALEWFLRKYNGLV